MCYINKTNLKLELENPDSIFFLEKQEEVENNMC